MVLLHVPHTISLYPLLMGELLSFIIKIMSTVHLFGKKNNDFFVKKSVLTLIRV